MHLQIMQNTYILTFNMAYMSIQKILKEMHF